MKTQDQIEDSAQIEVPPQKELIVLDFSQLLAKDSIIFHDNSEEDVEKVGKKIADVAKKIIPGTTQEIAHFVGLVDPDMGRHPDFMFSNSRKRGLAIKTSIQLAVYKSSSEGLQVQFGKPGLFESDDGSPYLYFETEISNGKTPILKCVLHQPDRSKYLMSRIRSLFGSLVSRS